MVFSEKTTLEDTPMRESSCTVIGFHLSESTIGTCSPWFFRFLLRWWRRQWKRFAGLLPTLLSTIALGSLYFLCLSLFLLQLAEHGW